MQDRLLSCDGFGTPEDDAVHHNQRDEEAERGVERRDERLHEHLHDGHEACDDDDEARDAHCIGDEVLDERDGGVGADEYEHRRQPHSHPIERRRGGRQRGTHPEEERKGRVLRRDAVAKDIEWFHREGLFLGGSRGGGGGLHRGAGAPSTIHRIEEGTATDGGGGDGVDLAAVFRDGERSRGLHIQTTHVTYAARLTLLVEPLRDA